MSCFARETGVVEHDESVLPLNFNSPYINLPCGGWGRCLRYEWVAAGEIAKHLTPFIISLSTYQTMGINTPKCTAALHQSQSSLRISGEPSHARWSLKHCTWTQSWMWIKMAKTWPAVHAFQAGGLLEMLWGMQAKQVRRNVPGCKAVEI